MPWMLSFPEHAQRGHELVTRHEFSAAAIAFEQAARTAPTDAFETEMLELAYSCLAIERTKTETWS
jgi:hypothetical protein